MKTKQRKRQETKNQQKKIRAKESKIIEPLSLSFLIHCNRTLFVLLILNRNAAAFQLLIM
jgi:hypothetical protein